MVTTILSVIAVVAAFAAVGALVLVPLLGDREREAEEAARAFFDRHGRWPDEPAP